MQVTKADSTYIIKLEPGEAVLKTLTDFCTSEGIKNGTLQAIGAVESVSCGYYELPTKQYHFRQYNEMVEVVSLQGNVALKDGAPFLHIHAVFTNTKNEAFGGHVEEMVVGVTLEVVLNVLPSKVERVYDEGIGLFLMNCGS